MTNPYESPEPEPTALSPRKSSTLAWTLLGAGLICGALGAAMLVWDAASYQVPGRNSRNVGESPLRISLATKAILGWAAIVLSQLTSLAGFTLLGLRRGARKQLLD